MRDDDAREALERVRAALARYRDEPCEYPNVRSNDVHFAEAALDLIERALTEEEAENARLRAQRDAYRDGYEARGDLLGCYRIGRRPADRLLDRLSRIGNRIAALSQDDTTEGGE